MMQLDPFGDLQLSPFRASVYRANPPEPPITLLFDPKEDMTAFELAKIWTYVGGVVPGKAFKSLAVKPLDYNRTARDLGSAFRHFRIDETVEKTRAIEGKLSDFIGKKITGPLLIELEKRLMGAAN